MATRRPDNCDVMPHHHFINGLTAAQYLTYLLAGTLYFSVFDALAIKIGWGVAAGALFVPLILGGYATALSLFVPRIAAIVAFICASPFLILGGSGIPIATHPNALFIIPALIVLAVSVAALLWSESSAWRHAKRKLAKAAILALAIAPATIATLWIGMFLFGFASALRRAR